MSAAVFVCSLVRRCAFVRTRAVAGIWSRRPCRGNGVVRVEIIWWTYRHRDRVYSCRWTFEWCCVLNQGLCSRPIWGLSNKSYVHGNYTPTL